MGIQQLLLGVGASKKTYIDDLFNTFLYRGNNSTLTINNGLDLTTEGGMIWVKNRDRARDSCIVDTERGIGYRLEPNNSNQGDSYVTSKNISSFTSTGFTLGVDEGHDEFNRNEDDYASWSFRKSKGFFDVVTYTGNGSARNISHSLGCVPGMILVKCTSHSADWAVYHRGTSSFPQGDGLYLNDTDGIGDIPGTDDWWDGNNRQPTSTTFGVGTNTRTNHNTRTYVAYVFAGGESTNALARSVGFSSTGSNDGAKSLTIASSSDTDLGSGDFTLECWFKDDAGTTEHDTIFALENYGEGGSDSGPGNSFSCYVYDKGIKIFDRTSGGFSLKTNLANTFYKSQWTHFAWTRSGSGSNNNTIWINGNNVAQFTGTLAYTDGQDFFIGGNDYARTGTPDRYGFNGNISNVRITKGQAVYTSAFKPSTTPITTTTGGATASNVEVICCNNSSITGSSVTSGTITSTNSPTASTDSPFDDPAGFVFGEAGDQNVIKCGSYVGSGSAGLEVNLGWEPQFLIIKRSNATKNWTMFDNMRGIATDGNDAFLYPNLADGESATGDELDLTPTGFKIKVTGAILNGSGDTYVWMAIRRPDGYVGKPIELGTDVFAMDSAASDEATIPNFDSGFPVDFALMRKPSTADSWMAGNRLLGTQFMYTDATDAEATESKLVWDSNLGIYKDIPTSFMGWLWKRHAGMDVICYEGNGVNGRSIAHSMNDVPEMMIVKRRSSTEDWTVYHTGMTNFNHHMTLNATNAEYDMSAETDKIWKSVPTSTHFEIGSHDRVNTNGEDYLALLFSSIDGISKVGSYTGNATDSDPTSGTNTITFGFQPRMVIVKSYDYANTEWVILDTVRGWASGNNTKRLRLNLTNAQNTEECGYPTSTGMVLTGNGGGLLNANNKNYIYYAHA